MLTQNNKYWLLTVDNKDLILKYGLTYFLQSNTERSFLFKEKSFDAMGEGSSLKSMKGGLCKTYKYKNI